jgi:hypothetical protein
MNVEMKYGKDVSRTDSVAASWLFNFSQRLTRRSFISKLAKLGLIAGAVEAGLPILPIDRRIPPAAAEDLCYACNYCGLRGWPCEYTSCQGTPSSCPSHTFLGTGWYMCCTCSKGSALFYYQDCCYNICVTNYNRCPPLCHTNTKCLNAGCNGCPGGFAPCKDTYCCTLNEAIQAC